MNPVEKAARSVCRLEGELEDDVSVSAPRCAAYLLQVKVVLEALHEPNASIKKAGSEIIRHVGSEESDLGYQSDAANVWRFMIDALRQDTHNLRQDFQSQ